MNTPIKPHLYFYEFAELEGMCTKTLKKKLRSKGYKGPLRGLLPFELISRLQVLLHKDSNNLISSKS